MIPRKVPSSKTPLPQESFSAGKSSGSRPYLDGPKSAPCAQTRKMAASASGKFDPASDTTASNITPISNTFVHIVKLRFLKRSAVYTPLIGNRLNVDEHH